MDTNRLLAEASALEDESIRTCQDSDSMISSLMSRCNEATKQTEGCLNKRIKKVTQLKCALEKQLLETIQIIKAAQNSLANTKRVLDGQNFIVPNASQTLVCKDLEEYDGGAAEDTDIVPGIDMYNEPVEQSIVALSQKSQATMDALDRLKESEAQLREDFKNKDLALRIDEMCRKVTPRNAPEGGRASPLSRTQTPFSAIPEHSPTSETAIAQQLLTSNAQ